MGEPFPIFIKHTPIVIHINSRMRVSNPVYTPNALGIANPLTANANPPSRAPNCMGEKKNKLLKSDEKAMMRMQLAKLTLSVSMFNMK